MTGVPLDLGEAEVETSTPPTTSTPVVPTPSLSEGLPAMWMIPTLGSRVQSSETAGARTQTPTPTQTTTHTTTEDDKPPPPEPDPMPWPLVDNPLPDGEEEDVALEEELVRQADRVYLRWDRGNWWFVPQFSMAPDHAAFFLLQQGYDHRIYESWRMRSSKRLREIMHGIRNKGAPHGWIREDLWARLVEFWQQEDFKKLKQALELGQTPTQSEVFARTHTRKEDREWVDKRLSDVNEVRCPPIDEAAVWAWVAGGHKRGRVYGMDVVPSHKYPPLFSDPDDDDTTSGPPDLREQVTLLNREISQQAKAHAQSLDVVEAVCAEKVRTLESTVQTQPQEVSDLRRSYLDIQLPDSDAEWHIRLRFDARHASPLPPPPPPPPAPSQTPASSQTPPPQPDQTTGSPHHDDDTDYV
ncbi:hypothetical protein PIB30_090041 [Stylosanthes scabra]|uniref:Uncharacterized protein n=1 Tax=Stylosanthes scabra TaxID=79078 RepID=A0ABU6YT57_9FABA|nr:hypothetical protein [Stylosanthes scabra]